MNEYHFREGVAGSKGGPMACTITVRVLAEGHDDEGWCRKQGTRLPARVRHDKTPLTYVFDHRPAMNGLFPAMGGRFWSSVSLL